VQLCNLYHGVDLGGYGRVPLCPGRLRTGPAQAGFTVDRARHESIEDCIGRLGRCDIDGLLAGFND